MGVTVKTTTLHESRTARRDVTTRLRTVEIAGRRWVELRDFLTSSNSTSRGYTLPTDLDELEGLANAVLSYVEAERMAVA